LAGGNEILNKGEHLFHEGDGSDGMFVIRQGEIQIYLEQGGTEVHLATIEAGGMIGEMALFDKKPRSASAKVASDQTEVTRISNEDFLRVLKQVPKWFVTLMSSLSSRLRDTNQKLQRLEKELHGERIPMDNLLKCLSVLSLIWHKEGYKEGKQWFLERDLVENQIAEILKIPPAIPKDILATFVLSGFYALKKNNYKKDVLMTPNRGILERFTKFLVKFNKSFPDDRGFPKSFVTICLIIAKYQDESGYDYVTVPFEEIIATGKEKGKDTSTWKDSIGYFRQMKEYVSLVKIGEGQIGLKIRRKDYSRFITYCKILDELDKAGVT